MLQIKNISKTYKTGNLVQRALDDVSLNLRDNEFVAILGPSGSGKTTLLNIIGGLDRYDSGDLIINGISTKKYKDRDWDSYRNHTVGFVFQSYNLIPHQTVLANVELALTISGISGKERRERAIKALEEVGLGEQIHKKPNQMSGGQMQRVSLARALVNNPDILLADEPTGALDSETSIQVMDLLKEVAKDRLVVMVTHNPELAYQYATRIVKVKDGKLLEDSDPYEIPEGEAPEPVHKNMGKSSMSFLTALSLSFNNLKTKKARTILVSFAGSIGIIGIAMILSLSHGVNKYIEDMEEKTMSEYPLQITKTTTNMMSMSEDMMSSKKATSTDNKVREMQILTQMVSGTEYNDLKSLKTYLESGQSDIKNQTKAIEYDYGITPQIYLQEDNGDVRKVCPDQTLSSLTGSSSMMLAMMGSSGMEQFHALPENEALYKDQYDVKAGHWPENDHECVVILTQNGQLYDMTLYSLGLKSGEELDKILEAVKEDQSVEINEEPGTYDYNDFLGITLKLVNASDYYVYDDEFSVWKDKSDNQQYVKDLVKNGEDLKVVGVVQPKEGQDFTMLTAGVGYPASLLDHVIDKAAQSDIVKDQLKDKKTNVFNGKSFDDPDDEGGLNMEDLFKIDEEAFKDAFKIDTSRMNMDTSAFSDMDFSGVDMSDLIDADALSGAMPSFSTKDIQDILNGVSVNLTKDTMTELFNALLKGYQDSVGDDPATDITGLTAGLKQYLTSDEAVQYLSQKLKDILQPQLEGVITEDMLKSFVGRVMEDYQDFALKQENPDDFNANFRAYLETDAVSRILSEELAGIKDKLSGVTITDDQIKEILTDLANGYGEYAKANNLAQPDKIQAAFLKYISSDAGQKLLLQYVEKIVDTKTLQANLQNKMASVMGGFTNELTSQISSAMGKVMEQVGTNLQKSMGNAMTSLMGNMQDIFSIDPDAFAKAIQVNMSEDDLQELMTSLMTTGTVSYESNLNKMGYADEDDPQTISIYPIDFDSKQVVDQIIEDYNDDMKNSGQDDKVISYTDMVGMMMSSVTSIVNMISYVLIAFVAISLVVSSIMIGVITYISVLERRKEIGILRAIGASKGNVGAVFNAETFIIGLLAGVIGIVLTLIAIFPTNYIIHTVSGNTDVNAALPIGAAFILIALSVVLTLLGGLIPANKASKSDPVTALRTE
ncbi:ABC-type antimicrobial peptide transport system, ATPase component [Coprococcus catus GD/7]|uniref:ABC-type antimicrobial peptide transport system, ATPase component n=1 Tax=Coprococcus catus GD/7 TaxID=717962 RepID=D4JAI9_9FIRM|nr:ABC transporter ATP-binding protein/permease [Coprococcus catus]CBK81360.1 ABC-type antimicrobial peptide transport system, ATPase component [Coprococcus catus GD/7]